MYIPVGKIKKYISYFYMATETIIIISSVTGFIAAVTGIIRAFPDFIKSLPCSGDTEEKEPEPPDPQPPRPPCFCFYIISPPQRLPTLEELQDMADKIGASEALADGPVVEEIICT
tara:strand:+ start:1159 stop:1506 length:348 start_codon:yes stop_codon:yes gene_type:complete